MGAKPSSCCVACRASWAQQRKTDATLTEPMMPEVPSSGCEVVIESKCWRPTRCVVDAL